MAIPISECGYPHKKMRISLKKMRILIQKIALRSDTWKNENITLLQDWWINLL